MLARTLSRLDAELLRPFKNSVHPSCHGQKTIFGENDDNMDGFMRFDFFENFYIAKFIKANFSLLFLFPLFA